MEWFRSRLIALTILALLATSLLPLLLLGGIGLQNYAFQGQQTIDLASDRLRGEILEGLQQQATNTAYALASFLHSRDADLQTLASLSPDDNTYLTVAQTLKRQVWLETGTGEEQFVNLPLYREIAWVDDSGQEQVKVEMDCLPPYPTDCVMTVSDDLRNVSDPDETTFRHETYFTVARTLGPGEIYVSRPTGFYVSFNEAYRGAVSAGSGARFEGVIRSVMRVETDDRSGYVVTALDMTHVLEFISHLQPVAPAPAPAIDPLSGNFAYIVGSDGLTIAHPEHFRIAGVTRGGRAVETISADNLLAAGDFNVMGFLNPIFPQLMQRFSEQPFGTVPAYESEDQQRALAYAVVPYFTGSNYASDRGFGSVIVTVNADALNIGIDVFVRQQQAGLTRLIAQLGILILLTAVLVTLVTTFVATRVVYPLRELTRYTRAMEYRGLVSDEITHLKTFRGRGEVTQLARTFGVMAETVQARESEIQHLLSEADETLQKRVQELTRLGSIGRKLTATLNIDGILSLSTDTVLTQTGAEAVEILIHSDDEHDSSSVIEARQMRAGKTTLIDKPSSSKETMPLILEGVPIGQLSLYAPLDYRFTDEERTFTRQLTDWMSIAIHNAHVFDRLRDRS